MILSGKEIKNKLGKEICIDPFDEKLLNPNSYNLRLHNELLIYEDPVLDMKKPNKTNKIIIPEDGYILKPGELYLGRTLEYTKTDKYVPMLEGRSSIGRLGLFIHVTAGFGDVGFNGYWTLEMFVSVRLKYTPMFKSVKYITIPLKANMNAIEAENIKTTREFNPVSYIKILIDKV